MGPLRDPPPTNVLGGQGLAAVSTESSCVQMVLGAYGPAPHTTACGCQS